MGKTRLFRGIVPLFISVAVLVANAAPKTDQKLPKTLDEAIGTMVVSEKYNSRYSKVLSGTDPGEYEAQLIDDFQNNGGLWSNLGKVTEAGQKKKRLLVVRYGYSLDRHVGLYEAAIKAGYKSAALITDSSTSMDADFQPGETMHTDFKRARPADSEAGRAIQKLLAAGGKYNGVPYGVFFSPFFLETETSRNPLMHQKETFLVIDEGEGQEPLIIATSGTANLNPNPRFNRAFLVGDPRVAKYMYDHALLMQETFQKGGSIGDLPKTPPLRIDYEDGTWQEVAFTDGKNPLNDRISDFLETFLEPDAKGEVEEIILSEFVFTHSPTFNAIRGAKGAPGLLKKFPNMKIKGVLDGKFSTLFNYGFGAAFGGFNVDRPQGPPIFGLSYKDRQRVDIRIYQRPIEDRIEIDEDGAPTNRWLWHDKTMIVIYKGADGVRRARIATGSFNLSNNKYNAESQTLFDLRADSPWVTEFIQSIMEVRDSQKEFAVPVETAIFREVIAKMTGQGILQITLDQVNDLLGLANRNQYHELLLGLKEISKQKSNLAKRPPQSVIEQRLDSMSRFVKWWQPYKTERNSIERMSVRKLVTVGRILAYVDLKDVAKREHLESLMWERDLSEDEIAKQTRDAWKQMFPDTPFPEPKASAAGSPAPTNSTGPTDCNTAVGGEKKAA